MVIEQCRCVVIVVTLVSGVGLILAYDRAWLTNNGKNGAPPSPLVCGKGKFLSSTSDDPPEERCLKCRKDEYISESSHRLKGCYKCDEASVPFELVESKCMTTKNAVIGCVKGRYRALTNKGSGTYECHRCRDCKTVPGLPYEAAKCGKWHDTVCSKDPEKIAETVQDHSVPQYPSSPETSPPKRSFNRPHYTPVPDGIDTGRWYIVVIVINVIVVSLPLIIGLCKRGKGGRTRQTNY